MNDECSARWFMNLLLYSFVLVIHFLFPGGEYMNGVFRINNFRGRFVSTGRIPGRQFFFLFLSLSLWKISRNLDFSKFLWKINGTENSEPAGFSSCWRKVGELTTWPRKNLLPKKDLLAWIIFRWSSKLFRYLGIISWLELIFPFLRHPYPLFSFNNYSISIREFPVTGIISLYH